jgi:seryl-tRNA synthetase
MQLPWNSDAANTQEAETNPFQISDVANPQDGQTEKTIAATIRNNKTITSLLERARSIQQKQKKLKEDVIENGSRAASQPWAEIVEKLAHLHKIGSDLEQSKVVLEGEWRDLLGKIKKSSERKRGRS